MNIWDVTPSCQDANIHTRDFLKQPTKTKKEEQKVSEATKKIHGYPSYRSFCTDESGDPDLQNPKETEKKDSVPNPLDTQACPKNPTKWKRTSGKILWKRLSQTDLRHSQGTNHAQYNWTLVAEKIAVIIRDLKDIRALGFKGVVIKEDFWTQSLYANVEGSAGFPDITRVWRVETEKLEQEGKETLPFEEWVRQHHDEINRKLPNTPKIQYLDPSHAKKYMAHIENGKFTLSAIRGIMPIDQETHSTIDYTTGDWMEKDNLPGGKGYANFVISKEKEFFLGSHAGGIFHHTSFQKGAVVIGAGAIAIGHTPLNLILDEFFIEQLKMKETDNKSLPKLLQLLGGNLSTVCLIPKPAQEGEMRVLTSTSGHYKPDKENLVDTLKVCLEKGIDLSHVITIEESELGQAYFDSGLEYLKSQGACKPYRCNNVYVAWSADKNAFIGTFIKGDAPRITKRDLKGLKLFLEHGIDLAHKDIFKITSFGVLTFPGSEYIKTADKTKTTHPTSWNLGSLSYDDKGMINSITSKDYRVILKLLQFLKDISTPEDYAKIKVTYENRSFSSPEQFEHCF